MLSIQSRGLCVMFIVCVVMCVFLCVVYVCVSVIYVMCV